MKERVKMVVEIEATVPQALSLQAMFEYWNHLGSAGGSRRVAFYVDGDGDFKPKCKVSFEGEVPKITKEISKLAIVEDKGGDRLYDFDPIGWHLRKKKNNV